MRKQSSYPTLKRLKSVLDLGRGGGSGIGAKLPRLAALAADMTTGTEPQFVALASGLQALHAVANALTEETGERTRQMRQKLRSIRLTGDEGVTGRALRKLHNGIAETSAELAELTEIARSLTVLERDAAEMGGIARFLQLAGYGFAIESSRHEDCARVFTGFVAEIRRLATEISDTSDEIQTRSAGTRRDVEAARESLSSSLTGLRVLADQANRDVTQASEQTMRLIDYFGRALDEAESRAKNIAAHVADASHYLQYGDIVRQKLEHIETSLREAGGTMAERRFAVTERTLAIQEAQVDLIHKEIAAARDRLGTAFSGIGRESTAVIDAMRDLDQAHDGGSASRAPFAMLHEELGRLESLSGRGGQLCDDARRISKSSIDACSQFAGYLDRVAQLNHEIHRLGLNAIVMASSLGDMGRTLAVISDEIQGVFETSRQLVTRIAQNLSDLNSRRSMAGSGGEQTEISAADSNSCTSELLALDRELESAKNSARALAEKQRSALDEANTRFQILESLGTAVAELRDELREVCSEFKRQMPAGEPGRETDTPQLDAIYTMESEREIYARLTGGEPPAASEPGDSDGNIELF